MPGHINLCFVWHMHQPFYKDLISGEYKLPWTRMHALKDYYGMVKILEEFPNVHQTFNLVPSMLVQIGEYASGTAVDPFLRLALKPAEDLEEGEKEFLLRYFFQASQQVIERYPRYAELSRVLQSTHSNPQLAARRFDRQMIRDLQVLSQLAWFDEEYLTGDHEVSALAAKGRNFSLEDQFSLGRKQREVCILDGENAWEFYDRSGRPFLRYLYSLISRDPAMSALTVTEALDRVPSQPLHTIFPGSWINANFDVWIGAEEDNRAWEYLLAARQTYERVANSSKSRTLPAKSLELAWEEILIAEGSDWCWWYGPEHSSANRPEFDQLYRDHLANVYRLLEEPVPTELSRPILTGVAASQQEPPTGTIRAVIDGAVTSYFEWLGAGFYRIDHRSGAMHSQRSLIQELRYGTDGRNIYLRLDFTEPVSGGHEIEFRLQLRNSAGGRFEARHRWRDGRLELVSTNMQAGAVCAALGSIYEASVSMSGVDVRHGDSVWLSLSIFRDGLPVAALPLDGELEVDTRESTAWVF